MHSHCTTSHEVLKKTSATKNRCLNRGAWTSEEDRKLAQFVEIYGPKRWKSVAVNSGLNRCGKSCRLRWLNYLRPDIKRGDISDAEDDLILRLHRLLGNMWSLIAQRLPGRTDNEIKNYWNSHLSKKAKLMEKLPAAPTIGLQVRTSVSVSDDEEKTVESMDFDKEVEDGAELSSSDAYGELFDFSTKGTYGLEWVKSFLELEEDSLK